MTKALALAVSVVAFASAGLADEPGRPVRLLLIGQGPDGHPWNTHEYRAGLRILEKLLADVPGLDVETVDALENGRAIPEKVDAADGVVLFLNQGAAWVGSDPRRLAAFRRLAERGGGISALHWGVGTKKDEYVEVATSLWGGCHGGKDRKYVVDVRRLVPSPNHPITAGLEPVEIRDEWYHRLKFATEGTLTPLWTVEIDGTPEVVSWAWERPGGGRGFGFVGLHFHANWGDETYRRFVTRGVLWTVGLEEPNPPPSLEFDRTDLESPRPKPAGKEPLLEPPFPETESP